jgi:hypothetical protein
MRARRKVQIAVAMVALVVAAYVVFSGVVAAYIMFSGNQRQSNDVSLIFQRYSDDADSYVSDVAFLLLTNASTKSYVVSMTGGSNTLVLDLLWGQNRRSLMINCEFIDETPIGWTNWTQMPMSRNAYASLGPHSGIVIRVPLSADGQRRKVAALFEGPTTTPSSFWMTPTGMRVFRLLPQSLRKRALPSGSLHRVWCDRELSYPTERIRQK